MRKLLLLLLTACAYAQNPNPQTNWSSQMSLAKPTNWLTFNQLTTPYLDSVTGTNWSAPPYFYTLGAGSNPATLSSAFASGYVILAGNAASSSCTIGEVQIQFYAAPGATGTLPVLTTTGTAPNFTVTQVATISYANTTALQTFVVGSGLSTSFPISSGSWVGTWGNSSQVLPGRGTSSTGYSYPAASSLPSGSNAYTSTSVGPSISASCETATGTILSGQAGFDITNPQQYSVSVPYNAPIIAPNDATGDFEYTQPWTLVKQIDNLQYAGSGVKYLVTKGNLGSNARPWWELYLTTYSGAPQLCFQINAATASYSAYNGVCSSTSGTQNLLLNGYNYTIVVTNAGGAGGGGAFQMFINGQPQTGALTISHYPGYLVSIAGSGGTGYSTTVPAIATSGTGGGGFLLATVTTSGGAFSSISIPVGYNYGFTSTPTVQIAPYVVAVTTAGSGYTGTATFTSTGGGCPSGSIAGTITTSGGGLSTISYTNESSLCTSAPTINITGTGTGGVVTASATPGSGMTLTPTASLGTLSTATTYPIINDGANVNGVLQGFSTVSTDSPLYDDEVAFFNTNLNETQGQALFYNTKFYQLGLYPSLPRFKLIWDNDCADPDNPYSLAFTIALHHAGILDLQAVIVEANDPYCFATYRQMLDQAGMNNVPVARPSSFVAGSSGSYTSANVTTFNASTDTTIADYPLAAAVYCAILAANPTTPVYVQLTGGMRGYVDFQQSASGTCTATQSGAQLQAQKCDQRGRDISPRSASSRIKRRWGSAVRPARPAPTIC